MNADSDTKARNRRTFRLADAAGTPIDAVYISNFEPGDRNFYAVTGTNGHFLYSSAAVGRRGDATLVVNALEVPEAVSEGYTRFRPYDTEERKGAQIKSALVRAERIGINGKLLPHKDVELLKGLGFTVVDITDVLDDMRVYKTAQEMASLREACRITSRIAERVPQMARDGMTEIDLVAEMEYGMRKEGAEGFAFETLVAFGENSAKPHHNSGRRQLREGDLVLVDFGAEVGRMGADITRTYVAGRPTTNQEALYGAVLTVQLDSLDMIRAGVDGRGIHDMAFSRLKEVGQRIGGKKGDQMTHGLGHSLGRFTHDGKRLSAHYVLPSGLVTTVEPGCYIQGMGGVRIEDDVVVTDDGCEILTDAPKDRLIEISG